MHRPTGAGLRVLGVLATANLEHTSTFAGGSHAWSFFQVRTVTVALNAGRWVGAARAEGAYCDCQNDTTVSWGHSAPKLHCKKQSRP
jgi:hypothetical protein